MIIFVKLSVFCFILILFTDDQVSSSDGVRNVPKSNKPSFSTGLESVRNYDEGENSGDGKNHHDVDDNSYDDDDKAEGSTYGSGDDIEPIPPKKITKCLQLLEKANGPGSFMPRCTYDGHFDALQCHGSECWCSTPSGQKVPGTTKKDPYTPKCNDLDSKYVDSKQNKMNKPTKLSSTKTTTTTSPATTTTTSKYITGKKQHTLKMKNNNNVNIIVDGIKTHDYKNTDLNAPYDTVGTKNNYNNPRNNKKLLPKKIHPNRNYNNVNANNNINNYHYNLSTESQAMHKVTTLDSRFTISQFISQPGILAGIICVGVVILLCFITILIYTIFKLRRKSYYAKEKIQAKPVVKVNTNASNEVVNNDNNSYYRNGGTGSHISGGGGFGDIYSGGGFSYTSGYSPARCNTMNNNKMSPWSAGGVVGNTTIRNSAAYSKCMDRNFYA